MYPKTEADRVKYWTTHIGFVQSKVKPLFEACATLQAQYFNEASTEREAGIGDSGGGDEEHVRRTKSGLIFGYIDQSLANMLDREPTFQATAENDFAAKPIELNNPNSLTMATGVSKISNYRYRETNQLRVDEEMTRNAFVFPYGVCKIGFEQDDDLVSQELLQLDSTVDGLETPEEENTFIVGGMEVFVDPDHDHRGHIDVHTRAMKLALSELDGNEEAEVLIKYSFKQHIRLHNIFYDRPDPDANTNVRRGEPYAINWQPDMFLTDDMSMTGLQDARWIAFGWELPIEEVQANANYEHTGDLEPTRYKGVPEKSDDDFSDGFDMIRGWEVWAKNFPIGRGKFRDLFFTIAESGKNAEGTHSHFLQYEEEWPYDRLDDYPAETVCFQTGLRKWFHKPTLLMAGGDTVQALTNEILDSFLYTVRKQKNIWLFDPASGISREILQDILDAPDGSVVEVPGLIEHGSNAIIPLPFQQVPMEKGNLLAVLKDQFDIGAGTPQPQRQAQPDSATEAQIIENRNTSRENRRSALVSEMQVRKARKMLQLDMQFRPPKLFLLDKDANSFLEISAELAKGEYLLTMDVSSHTTAIATERSQWMDLLNLFAGLTPVLMETFGAPPNLPELARRLLVRGFDEKDVGVILPMLEQAAAAMGANGEPGLQPPGVGEGGGTEFADPQAQAAQEAVQQGRNGNNGIGPLSPDEFNRDIAQEGGLQGAAVTP